MKKLSNALFGLWLPILLFSLQTIQVSFELIRGTLSLLDIVFYLSIIILSVLWLKEYKDGKVPNNNDLTPVDTITPESKESRNLEQLSNQRDASLATSVNTLVDVCYQASFNAGWHTNIETGELLDRNRAEMLCLIHSEISEAMEGERKNLMDDHLPNRPMAAVELADAVIRIADYAGRWGYDLGGAIVEKLAYNANRADHKIENRLKGNGKKF